MFPRDSRLTRKTFEDALQGKSFHEVHLSMKVAIKKGLTKSLFSVVVPKAVSKLATERNRVKRKIREALKMKINGQAEAHMVVVFAKKGILPLPFSSYLQEITSLLKKASI